MEAGTIPVTIQTFLLKLVTILRIIRRPILQKYFGCCWACHYVLFKHNVCNALTYMYSSSILEAVLQHTFYTVQEYQLEKSIQMWGGWGAS